MHRMMVILLSVAMLLTQIGGASAMASATVDSRQATSIDEIADEGPPDRATRFDGTGPVTYPHEDRFDTSAAMTLEAWVYRSDETGCEAIVDHNLSLSYWFGTCPRPRFYRSGPGFAEADTQIHSNRWTHVAVSYDGSVAQFYINGDDAGSGSVGFGGLLANDLRIGGSATGNFLTGRLDEVRLWSVARTQEQIRATMFEELTSVGNAIGLQAVWGDGGRHEVLQDGTGTAGSGVVASVNGILPRDLVAPKAATPPTLDGDVDPTFEYAGAEQLPIRYARTAPDSESEMAPSADKVAYLVYTENDLFVGMRSAARFAGSQGAENSWIGLLLDPSYARDEQAQSTQIRIKIPLDSESPDTATVQVGDGSGGFVECTGVDCPTRGVDWDVRKDLSGDDVGGQDLAIEIRLAKSLLGEWTEVDGFAIGQFDAPTTQGDYLAPTDAVAGSPATWATLSYGENSASLPSVRIKGKIFGGPDSDSAPLAGYKVTFGIPGTVTYERTTDANGAYSFNVPLPANRALSLITDSCNFCRYGTPQIGDTGTKPFGADELSPSNNVTYVGCTDAACLFADVDFFVMQPPGATRLDDPPAVPTAVMMLKTGTSFQTPNDRVELVGENFHDQLEIFLAPDTADLSQSNWVLYPVPIDSISQDATTITLQMPPLPKTTRRSLPNGPVVNTLGVDWRWVVVDNWVRPAWSDAFRSEPVRLTPPLYPDLYGFAFDNEDDDASYNEFLAVYGDSAYVCIGAFGLCATHVIDPLYASLYFVAYKLMIDDSGGSCVGMSSTSLLMQKGVISPAQFDANVLFAAGFRTKDESAEWEIDGALGRLTTPPEPANLWAHIRRNHGTQISAELWGVALSQIADQAADGYMDRRLNILRSNPTGYVISMKNPDKTFGGHAVTPYRVVGSRVDVYDNNDPLDTGNYVDLNPSDDTFTFPRPTKSETWSGGGVLFTFPITIWQGRRTFPTALDSLLTSFVFGDGGGAAAGGTSALFSTPGGEWGTREDRSFVNTLPGAQTIPIPGQSNDIDRPTGPLLLPASGPAPTVTINSQDERYLFMSGEGGKVLQVQAANSTPGDRDTIALHVENDSLIGMALTPQRSSTQLLPKVGMALGEQERLLFRFWQLDVPGGQTAGFQALPAAHAVVYENASDQGSSYSLIVDAVDGAAEAVGTYIFGPIDAAAGAQQRLVVAQWPQGDALRVETDADGDGVFESETVLSGSECASEDADLDGIPDRCTDVESGSGEIYLPMIVQ
jgi:hypothetical protein